MMRKLVLWLLLAPLPFNGLWMVCNDAPSQDPAPAESSAKTENAPDCTKMCAMKSAAQSGAVCFLSAGNKASVTIIVFGAAILPPEFRLQPLAQARQSLAATPDFYLSPGLLQETPPPKA
jgi:hypothetical protein